MSLSNWTYPVEANKLRVNSYIMFDKMAARITHLSKSKTGKHGGSKISFTVKGIFEDKKGDGFIMSYDKMESPQVLKTDFYVMDIEKPSSENDFKPFLSLMNEEDGSTRADIRVDDQEMADKIFSAVVESGKDVSVNVLQAMEKCRVISYKMM